MVKPWEEVVARLLASFHQAPAAPQHELEGQAEATAPLALGAWRTVTHPICELHIDGMAPRLPPAKEPRYTRSPSPWGAEQE
jgi:hypothetical protein